MSLSSGLRSAMKLLSSAELIMPKSGCRGIHSTAVRRLDLFKYGPNYGPHTEPAYVHRKHMYEIGKMKHRELKVYTFAFGVVFLGTAIPIWAMNFQQKKAQG